jgi:hypothetical protein
VQKFRAAAIQFSNKKRNEDVELENQVATLTMANANLVKELDDAQRIAAATAKDKRRLMQAPIPRMALPHPIPHRAFHW